MGRDAGKRTGCGPSVPFLRQMEKRYANERKLCFIEVVGN